MAKVKAEQFIDEIFWLDILNKISLESEEEEEVNIKIDDWDWRIIKLIYQDTNKSKQILIFCSNHNNIWHLSKTEYKKRLVKKSCYCYLEGTNHTDFHNKKDITINRNGFEFRGFEIKQVNPRKKE
jgi:hypothetical protein